MRPKINNKNILSYKKWTEIKKLKKKDIIKFYKKFINNYNLLNKKYFFNMEFSKKYVLDQISNFDQKKENTLRYLPIGIKDNINTKYLSTNYGLKIKKNFKVGNNANIVSKILDKNGIIFSKTICAEFAVHHIDSKLNINPHNKNHIAGTSSTGSAIAVACGALPVALGTQTAGSIIRPASFCGVYGFKPTFGAIDRTGILKNNDLFDTVGFISNEIQFIELIFKSTINISKDHPWTKNYLLKQSRLKNKTKIVIGYINDSLEIYKKVSPDVMNFYDNFINKINKKFQTKLINGKMFKNFHYYYDIFYNKSLSYYIKNYTINKKNISKNLIKIINKGECISQKEYNEALKQITIIKKKIKILMGKFDYIIIPSTFSRAPLKNNLEIDDTCLIWTTLGFPCLNMPFKFFKDKLPFGLMLVSNEFNDFALLDFAKKMKNSNN